MKPLEIILIVIIILLLLTVLSLTIAFLKSNDSKYSCTSGLCKKDSSGDFSSQTACENNCKQIEVSGCIPSRSVCNDDSILSQDNCENLGICKWDIGSSKCGTDTNLKNISKLICPPIHNKEICRETKMCDFINII